MLLIYQMKFYKWCLSVGRTLLCVLEMEIEQMYESMSNCPCQRPFEWDLSDGRRSNSVDQFWWTSFAQSSNRFRALHHAEFRKCHVLAYRAASSLLFYTQIYLLILGTTDGSEWCLSAMSCGNLLHVRIVSTSTMMAQQQSANWPSCSAPYNKNEIPSTRIRSDLKSFELLVFIFCRPPKRNTFSPEFTERIAQNLWTILPNGTFHILFIMKWNTLPSCFAFTRKIRTTVCGTMFLCWMATAIYQRVNEHFLIARGH